jgi:murein DD-endopeptidase MepM/ murein hydrolase activator NlpD
MRVWPWLLGGGTAALAAYYWTRRTGDVPTVFGRNAEPPTTPDALLARTEPLAARWVWPLGVWHGRKPEISDGYSSMRRTPTGQLITHGGVDVMYRRCPGDPWRAGTPNGTPRFVMPDERAALAASDGVVSFAAKTPRGFAVIIDHAPRKLATYYTHLSSLLVATKQRVSAGAPIGVIGADPLDGQHIMHLHFETWRGGASDRFDPQPAMLASWDYLPDPGDRPSLVARNARVSDLRKSIRPRGSSWPRRGVEIAPYPPSPERTAPHD